MEQENRLGFRAPESISQGFLPYLKNPALMYSLQKHLMDELYY